MPDTVTISRACAERAVRAPKTGNWSALDEIADALSSPPPPSDTVTISRECAWLIYFDDRDMPPEIFTGCGAEDAAHKRFKMVSGNWNCALFQSVSPSPPPASGLREALARARAKDCYKLRVRLSKKIGEMPVGPPINGITLREVHGGLIDQIASVAAVECTYGGALASPDHGWVKVDGSQDLPNDLQEGDEVSAVVRNGRLGTTWHEVTAYRRRPSAEQGG